jgi:hypothetical protein
VRRAPPIVFGSSNDPLGLLRFPGLKIETWGTRAFQVLRRWFILGGSLDQRDEKAVGVKDAGLETKRAVVCQATA